jgi:hypothetical protein
VHARNPTLDYCISVSCNLILWGIFFFIFFFHFQVWSMGDWWMDFMLRIRIPSHVDVRLNKFKYNPKDILKASVIWNNVEHVLLSLSHWACGPTMMSVINHMARSEPALSWHRRYGGLNAFMKQREISSQCLLYSSFIILWHLWFT